MNIAVRSGSESVQDWPHGLGAYNLCLYLEMGQHVDIIAIYRRHRYIIARFRVRQLCVAVLVIVSRFRFVKEKATAWVLDTAVSLHE